MLATSTTSCSDTSTSSGRTPDATAVSTANAVSDAPCAYAALPAHRTGARSGSPVQYMFPDDAITPRSDACHDERGPLDPNGVTTTQIESARPPARVPPASTMSASSSAPAWTPRSPRSRAVMRVTAVSARSQHVRPSINGPVPDTRVRLLLASMAPLRIVSADAHVLEPPHIWETWLPKQYHDKAPRLAKDHEGGDAWQFAGSPDPDPIGLVTTPGLPYDQFRWTGVTYEQARRGCYDGTARLADMDLDGVDVEILFPPQRTIGHFLGDDDDDFVRAGVDAYNDFLWDEFCAPDRSRLVGMAQMPSTGVDDMIETLRKAKARGFKGVVISCWPSAGDGISDADDPFWAAAAEEGMPVCIHINLTGREARQRARAVSRQSLYGRGAQPAKANAKAVGGLAGVFSTVPNTIGQLIFTGVFERFPDLQVPLIETGVGWIPHLLEQMDDRYWRNRSWGNIPITEPPSYYWFRNLSATFINDRNGIANRNAVGVDNMMWSTDYPHHGNDWPYSRKVINDAMADVSADDRHKILAGNAIRIFNLDS